MLQSRLTHLQDRFAEPDDPDASARILRAAAELFTSSGYEGTSTDTIAKHADVKPSALYRLFESKDAILVAALETIFEGFLADMEEAVAGVTDPCARLVRLTWAHTWLQLTADVFGRGGIGMLFSTGQLLSSVSEGRSVRLRSLARSHVENMREIIEEGVRCGLFTVPDLRSSAQAILTMAEYSPLWFRSGGRLTPEELSDHHAVYALRLVGASDEVLDTMRRDGVHTYLTDQVAGHA